MRSLTLSDSATADRRFVLAAHCYSFVSVLAVRDRKLEIIKKEVRLAPGTTSRLRSPDHNIGGVAPDADPLSWIVGGYQWLKKLQLVFE